MARSDGRNVFLFRFGDEDRYRGYRLIQEGVERYGRRIPGFCVMGNHAHLALQAGETPLAKILPNLSFRYTPWVNRSQRRRGHWFPGRYQAVRVEAQAYRRERVRSIH